MNFYVWEVKLGNGIANAGYPIPMLCGWKDVGGVFIMIALAMTLVDLLNIESLR